jgi:hypothetical protein
MAGGDDSILPVEEIHVFKVEAMLLKIGNPLRFVPADFHNLYVH